MNSPMEPTMNQFQCAVAKSGIRRAFVFALSFLVGLSGCFKSPSPYSDSAVIELIYSWSQSKNYPIFSRVTKPAKSQYPHKNSGKGIDLTLGFPNRDEAFTIKTPKGLLELTLQVRSGNVEAVYLTDSVPGSGAEEAEAALRNAFTTLHIVRAEKND